MVDEFRPENVGRRILLFLDNAPAQEYLGKHKQFAQVTGTADLLSNIMNVSDIVNKMSITAVKQKAIRLYGHCTECMSSNRLI
jgi:hypothetical protein